MEAITLRRPSQRVMNNGGRDPEKKDRQERHRPLVSIKNIDEATLSLLSSQKIGDLAIFFCRTIL